MEASVPSLPVVLRTLLILAVFLHATSTSPTTTYCVSPASAPAVFVHSKEQTVCHPLSYYLEDISKYFTSHTEFVFLEGEHYFQTGELVLLRNLNEITFVGNGTLNYQTQGGLSWVESSSRINCIGNHSGLSFVNVTALSFYNITFKSCGAIVPKMLADEVLFQQTYSLYKMSYDLKTSVFMANVSDVIMNTVTVRDGVGYGVLGINVLGASFISNSVFVNNNKNVCIELQVGSPGEQGGNSLFVFGDSIQCRTKKVEMQIRNSIFAFGADNTGNFQNTYSQYDRYLHSGSGLGFMLGQTAYQLQLSLDGIICANNSAYKGANMRIDAFDVSANFNVSINNVTSFNGSGINQTTIDGAVLFEGTGVGFSYQYGFSPYVVHCKPENTTFQHLYVSNSTFHSNRGNKGVGIDFHLWPRSGIIGDNNRVQITLRNCNITENEGFANGIGLCINEVSRTDPLFNIVMEETRISRSRLPWSLNKLPSIMLQSLFSAITLATVKNVTVLRSKFVENEISALYSCGSTMTFSGEVIFATNKGINGGAMILDGHSKFYLQNGTNLWFVNNSALESGGAIYVYTHVDDPYETACFFQLGQDFNTITNVSEIGSSVQLNFELNSARVSGSQIYGGSIDRCYLISGPTFSKPSQSILKEFFHFESPPTNTSMFSSSPFSVCFCNDSTYDCKPKSPHSVSGYPGGTFTFRVLAVGQMDGITWPATVYLKAPNHTLKDDEKPQSIMSNCSELQYTLYSNDQSTKVHFQVENAVYLVRPQKFLVNFNRCPHGFTLSRSLPYMCECNRLLHKHNLKCNITNKTITRNSHVWVGFDNKSVIVSDYCPFDYCIPYEHHPHINPEEPDEQCAYDRGGTLCGSCNHNLSIVLGSNQCKSCSNSNLALLIAFAVAGIGLVFFLILLNLTVAVGTINGLVFYANLLQINHAVFFRNRVTFLSVFVSWLNLDLGIETCFYSELTPYTKAWLQFVFPVYLWIVMGFIIILCKWSVLMTRLCGTNAVPVLATLLLLSFTKIHSSITIALQFATLEHENGTTITVWRYDGSVGYLSPRHIPLFITATLFLIASSIYALLVAFSPWILMLSKPKFISKYLKPICDAYHGPFKNKHRYWTGLVLVVRCVLCLAFALTADKLAVNILVVLITILLLISWFWFAGGVYRKTWLSLLEFSFLLNVGILAAVTMYLERVSDQQRTGVIDTSVGISFATFIGILAYHIYQRCLKVHQCTRITGFLAHCLPAGMRDRENNIDSLSERLPILTNEERQHLTYQ